MKKRKVFSAALALLALILVTAFAWRFDRAMRRGAPTLDVSVRDVILEDGHFSLTASQGGNSGMAFRRSSYEIEDDALYVTLFSGLVYHNFRADTLRVDIRGGELDAVRQVYLRDDSTAKLIYAK